MTRVLVTGATGFVGRALTAALTKAGHHVVAAHRRASEINQAPGTTSVAVGDIGPDTDWGDALSNIDCVIHLAARVHVINETTDDPLAAYRRVNRDGTRNLAKQAATAGVARFIYLSTVKVNGERTGGERTAAMPFTATDPPKPTDPYAISKLEAERALAEIAADTAMETVIIRPTLVYGEGVGGNFRRLLGLCQSAPPLPLGAISNQRSMIYLGNLVDIIIKCVDHPEVAGKVYLVCDGEAVSTPGLIRAIGAALGRKQRLFPVPVVLLRLAGALTGRASAIARLVDSLVVDDKNLRDDLNWSPPFTTGDGLKKTAAWYKTASGQ